MNAFDRVVNKVDSNNKNEFWRNYQRDFDWGDQDFTVFEIEGLIPTEARNHEAKNDEARNDDKDAKPHGNKEVAMT